MGSGAERPIDVGTPIPGQHLGGGASGRFILVDGGCGQVKGRGQRQAPGWWCCQLGDGRLPRRHATIQVEQGAVFLCRHHAIPGCRYCANRRSSNGVGQPKIGSGLEMNTARQPGPNQTGFIHGEGLNGRRRPGETNVGGQAVGGGVGAPTAGAQVITTDTAMITIGVQIRFAADPEVIGADGQRAH